MILAPKYYTFKINTHATKRLPLEANATLSKFGFDPFKMGQLLASYWSLQQALLGEQNPHDFVFFEIKAAAQAL